MILFAHETDFWIRLKACWLVAGEMEYHYHANHISMTENYSENFYPVIIVENEVDNKPD